MALGPKEHGLLKWLSTEMNRPTSGGGMAGRNLYATLKEVADRQPGSTALVFKGQFDTYADLIGRIERAAAHLHAMGLRRGEAFSAYSLNRPEVIYALFAAAKLGAIFAPANVNLTIAELGYIVGHSDSKFIFHDPDASDLGDLRLAPGTCRSIAELGGSSDGASVDDAAGVSEGDDLLITYTSGSTAMPKAVVHDHASQIDVAAALREFWQLSPSDTTVVAAPFGFLLGLSTVTVASLLAGARVVIHEKFRPGDILEALVSHNAAIYNGVPTMFQMMLEYSEQQGRTYDLSKMRALVSSGAPMPEELSRRFSEAFGKELQNYFGMTESYPLFGRYTSDRAPYPEGAAGRVSPGAIIRVVDSNGRECARGESGELHVRAAATIKRYHKNPELTAASFQNGLLKTGDLGYVDSAGFVYLTGRAKDIIKCGGSNVAPAEVEGVLLQFPNVQAVAVIGVPDKVFGEVPVSFVVMKPGASSTEVQLLEFAAGRLAKYKVPAHVRYVENLPQGPTGKVDKRQLKAAWEKE